jgi:hypothetical protein
MSKETPANGDQLFAIGMAITIIIGACIGKLGQHTQIPVDEHHQPVMYEDLENYGKVRITNEHHHHHHHHRENIR